MDTLVFKDRICLEHKTNKQEIAFDRLSMAKQIRSTKEESQDKEAVILDGWDIAIGRAPVRYIIWTGEKGENHMYVLVVRGYRQLKTIL